MTEEITYSCSECGIAYPALESTQWPGMICEPCGDLYDDWGPEYASVGDGCGGLGREAVGVLVFFCFPLYAIFLFVATLLLPFTDLKKRFIG